MKNTIITLFCFPLFLFSQEKKSYNSIVAENNYPKIIYKNTIHTFDSINSNKNHIFDIKQKRISHIIDHYFNFQPNLGYCVTYNFEHFSIGTRLWFNYMSEKKDIPEYMQTRGVLSHFTIIGQIKIWKSINIDAQFGTSQPFKWPSKNNTIQNGVTTDKGVLFGTIATNITIFRHSFFRMGIGFSEGDASKKIYLSPVLSAGVKF